MVLKENFNLRLGYIVLFISKKDREGVIRKEIQWFAKSDFMLEMFGKHKGELNTLVDCKTGEQFDEKLSALKPKNETNENRV